jgi:hypothetical protein
MSELVLIKYGVGMGLAIYVIKQLFVLVGMLVKALNKNKKGPDENQLKETSRERIKESNDTLKTIKPEFFRMKDKVEDVHEVITAKVEGVPLVYNKGLEKSIERLNGTMTNLASSIKTLAEKSP